MKNLLFVLTGFVAFSCNSKRGENDITFSGYLEEDTIFLYQEGNAHFVTKGLVEQLQNGLVNSAQLRIDADTLPNFNNVLLTKENYKWSDTSNYDLGAGLYVREYSIEEFNTPTKYFSFYGYLEVHYASGDTVALADTLTFVRINPLDHPRMKGEMKSGNRNGLWFEYYDNAHSTILRKSFFEKGQRHGLDSVFHKNGKSIIVSNWQFGKMHGSTKYYNEHYGYLSRKTVYDYGVPAISKFYDEKGVLTDSVNLKSL